MQKKIIQMENKIQLHYIKEDKYKSNFIAVFLTVPMLRETVTINALIPAILKRGTSKYTNMQELEVQLQEMYGSNLSASIDKSGENHIFKFFTETIKDEIVGENLFEKSVENISQLILSPYLENGIFSNEYVMQEKNMLQNIISSKVNDKYVYSRNRCIEEMTGHTGYGIYTYGYVEDLSDINSASVYNQYIDVLKTSKIDIFVCTNKEEEEVKRYISKYFVNDILEQRNDIYVPMQAYISSVDKEKVVKESLDVVQGKLFVGVTIPNIEKMNTNDIAVLNAVLGVGSNSKLYRNVREKESLAYDAMSSYVRNTNILCIAAGIEIKNYEKTLNIIKKELNDLKKGNISKREFADAKRVLISSYKSLYDSPYSTINFYINRSIANEDISIEECIKQIENTKLSNIVDIAKKMKINTIYYLTNEKETNNESN